MVAWHSWAMADTRRTSRVLRRPAVQEQTGLKRSTLYAYVRLGTFPKPIHLGGRSVGWIASEVEHWIAQRIAESRASARETEVV